jgi:ABC-type transporter Mla subunit MlaD
VPLAVHDDRLTRRVGAGVLLVAALTVVFVVMILPRLGHGGVTVRVRFGVVVGLPEGAAVRVAGKDVGHVRAIRFARDRRRPGAPAGVVVELVIDPGWAARIPVNSDFFVDARSMLAPRYIAIGPPANHAEPERALVEGDVVDGIDPPSLDNVLQRTWESLEEIRRFLDAIRPAAQEIDAAAARLATTIRGLDPRPGASAALRAAVADATDAARSVARELGDGRVDPAAVARLVARVERLATRIEALAAELRGQVEVVRAALDRVGSTGLTPRVKALLDGADRALAGAEQLASSVRAVVGDATRGGGALAAFAADLELVDDVRELTKELKRQPWRVVGAPPR